jgi:hypothetical protein
VTTARATSSAPSALSKVIAISSSSKDGDQKPVINKDVEESDFELIGGLKDEVEISGVERDAAIASPLKGKKRLTSTACFSISISITRL